MSRWDDVRNDVDVKGLTTLSSAAFEYTCFYPSDPRRLWSMLCLGQRDRWSFADLYDLARFAEDFVLCDSVGVPDRLMEYIGPHLINSYNKAEDFPLFAFDKPLYELMLAFSARKYDDFDLSVLSSPIALSHESQRLDMEADELDRLIEELDEEAAALTSETDELNRLSQQEILPSGIESQYSERILKLNKQQREHDERSREFEHRCRKHIRQSRAVTRLFNFEVGFAAEPDFLEKKKKFNPFFKTLSASAQQCGISFSPGWKFREFFLNSGQRTLTKRLYAEVETIHREQIALIESWTKPRSYQVPPILAILLNQTESREQLPESLASLRYQFAGLRKTMRDTKASLDGDLTLKERLDVIRSLESARELILKKAGRPRQSIIRRTWDVVKGGSLFSIATKLADLLLEWDSERRLVGGIRHFVDLECLALDVRDEESHVRRLFGEIQD
jgi:hypothetical protein